jgi:hypothetical protein
MPGLKSLLWIAAISLGTQLALEHYRRMQHG